MHPEILQKKMLAARDRISTSITTLSEFAGISLDADQADLFAKVRRVRPLRPSQEIPLLRYEELIAVILESVVAKVEGPALAEIADAGQDREIVIADHNQDPEVVGHDPGAQGQTEIVEIAEIASPKIAEVEIADPDQDREIKLSILDAKRITGRGRK